MKIDVWRIKRSRDSNLWLDSFDGKEYQWTLNEEEAWPFLHYEFAAQRLEKVHATIPSAVVVESTEF